MELPRLATVCLVVATALAETVNFWASMANVCVKECGATRARDGADDVRSRVRSRPIVALETLSDPCVRARVVKKYRPPNPTSWRTECAYACGYRRMSERRVAPARANAPNAPRAAERARRRTRARFRDESARASNNALRGSRAEAGRARAGRVERRARDADGFRFVRLRFVAIAFGRRIARARGRIAIERGTRAR